MSECRSNEYGMKANSLSQWWVSDSVAGQIEKKNITTIYANKQLKYVLVRVEILHCCYRGVRPLAMGEKKTVYSNAKPHLHLHSQRELIFFSTRTDLPVFQREREREMFTLQLCTMHVRRTANVSKHTYVRASAYVSIPRSILYSVQCILFTEKWPYHIMAHILHVLPTHMHTAYTKTSKNVCVYSSLYNHTLLCLKWSRMEWKNIIPNT